MSGTVEQRLRRIIAGDREAALWLYDTFAPRLFRRLDRRYARPAGLDPNDLLRDAFVFFLQNDARVLATFLRRHAGREHSAAVLERYLWAQACSVVQVHPRLRSSRETTPISELEEAPGSPAPGHDLLSAAQRQRLDRCLHYADAQLYLDYKLRYSDGLSGEQAAKVAGWSVEEAAARHEALRATALRCVERLGIVLAHGEAVSDPEALLYSLSASEEEEPRALPQDGLLEAYRGGELADDRKIKLEIALGQSPASRHRLAALAKAALPEPKAALRRQVLKHLPQGGAWSSAPASKFPWPLMVGGIAVGALVVVLLWLSGATRLLFPAALPDDLAYEVTVQALPGDTPAVAGDEALTVSPERELRIAITPRGDGVDRVIFGLYRRGDDALEKVHMEDGLRLEAAGNGAVFTGPAAALAEAAEGEHELYAVIARAGDLPLRRPFHGQEPATAMEDGRRRLAYRLPPIRLRPGS